MKKLHLQKVILLLVVLLLINSPLFAQEITNQLSQVAAKVKGPLNIIVGILAIVGGFNVFYQYKSGNEKAKQNMIMLVLGLTVWFLLPSIIKVFIPTFTW